MECNICNIKYAYKSEFERHLNNNSHKIKAYDFMQANFEKEKREFQKKLEEANLERELSILREEKANIIEIYLFKHFIDFIFF